MNDFTKEELEELAGALSYWINRNEPQSESLIPLFEKLGLMIDNYCYHEWRCFDDQYNTRECIQCGEKRQGEIHE